MRFPLLLALAPIALASQTAPSDDALRQFVAGLRQASARDDRPALAGMMRYPLEVMAGGLKIPVPDETAFIDLYASIMTPALRAVIARAQVPKAGRTSPTVRRSAAGEISFEGALTISPGAGGFRVTHVSVPMTARPSTAGAAAARQLTFRAGRPTQVSGSLDPGGRDTYTFRAARGAFVDVRLSGIPGRSVLLRVVEAKTGRAVDARADVGTRVWNGRVGSTSDYRIEVVRQPDSGRETLIYTLSVEMR